jgi:hypothetical protein
MREAAPNGVARWSGAPSGWGYEMDEAIVDHAKKTHGLLVGQELVRCPVP